MFGEPARQGHNHPGHWAMYYLHGKSEEIAKKIFGKESETIRLKIEVRLRRRYGELRRKILADPYAGAWRNPPSQILALPDDEDGDR